MIFTVVFWISVACILHSYVVFPFLLRMLAAGRKLPQTADTELPFVSVLMSVYNEEEVLDAKIRSVLDSEYPAGKLEFLIGSDGSVDRTDSIILSYRQSVVPVRFYRFEGRNGKAAVLDSLVPHARGSVLLFTDANILFEKSTVSKLVRHFGDPTCGLVAAQILNSGLRREGISHQERAYIRRENRIKRDEGLLWGCMMGAFGACYAVRSSLFRQVPKHFLMEDFYITMSVLKKGFSAISDPEAVAYEDVSHAVREEFKRKVRISAGNFQNLGEFYSMLWPPWRPVGFCFLSHKVLRWFTPFFLILLFLCSLLLAGQNLFFAVMLIMLVATMCAPLIDWLAARMNMHIFVLRLVSYFYTMNLALILGFVKYCGGIRSSAWSPTQRNIQN